MGSAWTEITSGKIFGRISGRISRLIFFAGAKFVMYPGLVVIGMSDETCLIFRVDTSSRSQEQLKHCL